MPPGDRSIAELFADLTQNLRVLFRQELALARAELTSSLTQARRGAILLGAGIVVAWTGVLTLVATGCLGLIALGLPPVAAAGILAVVLLLTGLLLVRSGKASITPDRVTPHATMEALKNNAQLLRGQTR